MVYFTIIVKQNKSKTSKIWNLCERKLTVKVCCYPGALQGPPRAQTLPSPPHCILGHSPQSPAAEHTVKNMTTSRCNATFMAWMWTWTWNPIIPPPTHGCDVSEELPGVSHPGCGQDRGAGGQGSGHQVGVPLPHVGRQHASVTGGSDHSVMSAILHNIIFWNDIKKMTKKQ